MNEHKINPSLYPPKWDSSKSKVNIEVSTVVNASESIEKVTKAIENLFPQLEIQNVGGKSLIGSSSDETILFHFFELIFKQKILDVARRCAIQGSTLQSQTSERTKIVLFLNKQVAFKDKISFSEESESPLGPIYVSMETKDLEIFIDSYFPKYEWFK